MPLLCHSCYSSDAVLVHDVSNICLILAKEAFLVWWHHRQPGRTVSEINFQTIEPNMYVKLQAKLTAKESKYYQIVQNKHRLPYAECVLVHPGWVKFFRFLQ